MADYVHGKMDINQQKTMFDTFWRVTVRTSVFIIIVLLLMYLFLT